MADATGLKVENWRSRYLSEQRCSPGIGDISSILGNQNGLELRQVQRSRTPHRRLAVMGGKNHMRFVLGDSSCTNVPLLPSYGHPGCFHTYDPDHTTLRACYRSSRRMNSCESNTPKAHDVTKFDADVGADIFSDSLRNEGQPASCS